MMRCRKFDLYNHLFYIYMFIKQFYLFPSGGLQVGDVLFIILFVIYLMNNKIKISKNKYYLVLFIVLVILINTFYSIRYKEFSFVISSFYYIYNFFIILFIGNKKNDINFLYGLKKVCRINIYIQFIFSLLTFSSNNRIHGTFNDPNQFAFFVLSMMFFIRLLNTKVNDETNNYIDYIVATILIFMSTSVALSISVLLFWIIVLLLDKKIKVLLIITIPIVCVLFIYNYKTIEEAVFNSFLIDRFTMKIDDLNDYGFLNYYIEDRQMQYIFSNPRYLIFGSGEGYLQRFSMYGEKVLEIHSTLPAILFYYGIIPFCFLITWIYREIRKTDKELLLFLSIYLIESFTLANQRQPFIWMYIILCTATAFSKNNNIESHIVINKNSKNN